MVYNEALASRLRTVLAGQADVEEKRMFGGLSFMVGGQMCCGVLKDDLVLRVGASHFEAALALPGVRPFDFTGRPSTGMVYVASSGLSSAESLRAWVQRGLDYVKAHPSWVPPPENAAPRDVHHRPPRHLVAVLQGRCARPWLGCPAARLPDG